MASGNCLFQKNGNEFLVVFSSTDGFAASSDYSVRARLGSNEWIDVPVYFAEVTRKIIGKNLNSSFASLDISGAVEIEVTVNSDFENFVIRPDADNISAERSGNTLRFSVDKPCQLSIEADGEIMQNLQLFVNPLENFVPDKEDENVIYLEPGIHNFDNCIYITNERGEKKCNPTLYLESNQTLYIAGGAVLQAEVYVKTGSENVKILGRGIIDILPFNSESGTMPETKEKNSGFYPAGIRMVSSSNVEIDGVIIRNSCSYGVMGNGMRNVSINNIKLFNRGTCSDGIDFVASNDVTIKNCYIRSNDDGVAIYGSRWEFKGSSKNWLVENCVFMTDCAHSINIGTHGSQDESNRDEISNVIFRDIDILDVYEKIHGYWGAIAFTVGDENYIHDFTFENIRMYPIAGSRPFTIKTDLNSGFNPNPGYRIENILFKDIELLGTDYIKDFNEPSEIKGYNNERIVSGVCFENLKICGEKVDSDNANKFFNIGDNTENITFKE